MRKKERKSEIGNRMSEKRGMLLVEETLKMIIAVIALGFLVYFLVSLYFSKVQGNELIQAQADVNLLNNAIKNQESSEVILNNPIGWNLFSFIEKPVLNACANENCLCVCDEVLIDSFILFDENRQFDECNEDGACVVVKGLESFEPIEIEKITKILIKKEEGSVVISE